MKLSRFVYRGLCNISGRNWVKPRFLRKRPPSLMRGDGSRYKYYTDCRDSLALDMFGARFVEVRARSKEKIATGKDYPQVFVISRESPIARMYN